MNWHRQKQPPRHILEAQQFSKDSLEVLLRKTDLIRQTMDNPTGRVSLRQRFKNYLLFNVFYEPSTRTRLSFAAAGHHLGMQVHGTENAKEFSSAIKGESIEDSIRVLNGYRPDAIVVRHHQEGALQRAAKNSQSPVINAGDGSGQHPTQALLDLYTIYSRFKRLDNLVIVIGGDLAYGRTARSLIYLLSKYPDNKFFLCAPGPLKIGSDIKDYLDKKSITYVEIELQIEEAISQADVVYWTRLQKERLPDHQAGMFENLFTITAKTLDRMKENAIILHPLPRTSEIATEVDADPRAAYFEQAENGLYTRMALLEYVLEK